MADRPRIVEKTAEQIVSDNVEKVFHKVFNRTDVIPASMAGNHVIMFIVATGTDPNGNEIDAFETAIEGIPGLRKAYGIIKARLPVDRLPSGKELRIGGQLSIHMDRIPD